MKHSSNPLSWQRPKADTPCVTNGAIVIHTQRLKSDPGGNLLS
ncbi:chemotaxis protein [Yersinia pestis]|nr:chemotaxis protein [Yersinia pestis]EDR62671.1 truncated integrase [Yersinia pestis biovar Antiqua str. UG05-0454]